MSHADVYREKILGRGNGPCNDRNTGMHLALACSKNVKWSVWLKNNNVCACERNEMFLKRGGRQIIQGLESYSKNALPLCGKKKKTIRFANTGLGHLGKMEPR